MAAALSSSTATARMTVEGAPAWDLATLMPDGAVGASAPGASIVNALLYDHCVDDRLRRFPHWLARLNRDNEASDASVKALIHLDLLAAGGSRLPQRLAEMVGVDPSDPGFPATGLDLIGRNLEEARAVAAGIPA